MADQQDLANVDAALARESRSHRPFFVPIVRAIATLGGREKKGRVVSVVRELLKSQLNDKQLDYLEKNNRYGWARNALKKQGLVAGEYGYWELTELGRLYEAAHKENTLRVEADIPEAETPARSTIATESVQVTGFPAYQIPLLKVLALGTTEKKQIMATLEQQLKKDLLPGDRRLMPGGTPVWRFRAHWGLSNLGKDGHVENTGTGQWVITNTGRARLDKEGDDWKISQYQNARARVRIDGPPAKAPAGSSIPKGWLSLRSKFPKLLFDQLDARLRPDLGPSPDPPLGRNLVLYGPPGTGKTFIAKAVAEALTGEDGVSEDGHFRLVQFHPSYAYEDFVQGLRPDLKEPTLRYKLQKGPFLSIVEAAAQDPDSFFVLVIDEINRGDPARIFGELLYALEYRDEPVSLSLGGELLVPANLVVIGTMNSVDRSVALVDYALRRRFGFVRVDPDPEVISSVRREGLLSDVGPAVLQKFNVWLRDHLGREHVLGHSFFISPLIPDEAGDAFDRLWDLDVLPLLEEYFFGNEDGLKEAASQWAMIVKEACQAREEVQAETVADDREASS